MYISISFKLPVIILVFFFSLAASAVSLTGKAFELDNSDKLFCNFSYSENIDNGILKSSQTMHYAPDGRELVKEEVDFSKGTFTSYRFWQFQTGEESSVNVVNNRVIIEYKKNGKVSRGEEKKTENTVISPSLLLYLKEHFDILMQGKKIVVQLVVPKITQTIAMEALITEKKANGSEELVYLSLKPESSFYSLFVKPISFLFSVKHGKIDLVYFIAPSAAQRKNGNSYEEVRTKLVMDK